MHTYLALVHKDEGSAYGVSFPDLPGCFSAADDSGGIIPAASEALDLWFKTEPLVEPRSIEEVCQDVAADLADGAFLVAVPYVRRSTKQMRVNISMDAGTLDAIDTAAKQMRVTRSSFLVLAATNEIRGIKR